jgi:hypothetical protein
MSLNLCKSLLRSRKFEVQFCVFLKGSVPDVAF